MAGDAATRSGPSPQDASQALRLRRMLLAAGTSLLVPVVLAVSAALGLSDFALAGWATALILALTGVFYLLFRTGLNLRFHDPSLTAEMLLCAVLCVALFSYWAGRARPALEMFYPMAFLFGALRFHTRRLLTLAAVALTAHATMLVTWLARHPGADMAGSALDFLVLAIALPWFASMSAFVNTLRTRLTASNRQLIEALGRVERIAVRDELTGLYNRRFLMDFLEREAGRVLRTGGAFAVCLLDIDYFKNINDSFGHSMGDGVLHHFAGVAASVKRKVDVLGRLGGEEFLVVLPDAGVAGAEHCAERIRQAVAAFAFTGLPADYQVTVTAGVTRMHSGETIQALLARADSALYSGKAAGRNRVVAID